MFRETVSRASQGSQAATDEFASSNSNAPTRIASRVGTDIPISDYNIVPGTAVADDSVPRTPILTRNGRNDVNVSRGKSSLSGRNSPTG